MKLINSFRHYLPHLFSVRVVNQKIIHLTIAPSVFVRVGSVYVCVSYMIILWWLTSIYYKMRVNTHRTEHGRSREKKKTKRQSAIQTTTATTKQHTQQTTSSKNTTRRLLSSVCTFDLFAVAMSSRRVNAVILYNRASCLVIICF